MGDEQPSLPLGPRVRIPLYARDKPIAVWGICKAAALEADWSMRRWESFMEASDACLKNAANQKTGEPDVDLRAFMKTVSEHFEVL